MDQLADHPYWELRFDDAGRLTAPEREAFLAEANGLSDLVVISHGWNNSEAAARALYRSLFGGLAGRGGPTLGFAGVYWPSLWLPDPPTRARDAAGHAHSATAAAPPARLEDRSGAELTSFLQPAFTDLSQRATIDRLGTLIDQGAAAVDVEPAEVQRARLAEFHQLLATLVPAAGAATEDAGETALLLADDPERSYPQLARVFEVPGPAGDAEGVGENFRSVWNGAKEGLRVFSYYTMKSRAGTIGQHGLGPLLAALHRRTPGTSVHLVGHSFGARLVSCALAGIGSEQASPVGSLVLLQGAFSHFAFARAHDNPFSEPGALSGVADRVHGPLVATFSEHDWAVGRWYPRASFLAKQDASGLDGQQRRWGAMGSDGFQAVVPVENRDLLPAGQAYRFRPGRFYRVDGSGVINDVKQSSFSGAHSDIRGPEVCWLLAAAAGLG